MTTATQLETKPTDRQRAVHSFMIGHQREHGTPPTVREIGAALGIGSPNGVTYHLDVLVSLGYARRRDGGKGSRRVIAIDVESPRCPCCGQPAPRTEDES